MSTIVSLGSALQDIYLIDRDDFTAADIGDHSIFNKIFIGTKVDIDKIVYQVGGGGTNSAVTFARHGHRAIFLGNIGRDTAGEAVLTNLDEEGIDNSFVSIIPRKQTGCSVILLDAKTGSRTVLTHRGASASFSNLDENDLDRIQPDWLYVTTMRGDLATLERFFKRAHKLNCKIMFNPGNLELEQKTDLTKLLKYVEILLINREEASLLLRPKSKTSSPVTPRSLTEQMAHLIQLVPIAIITDGPMGSIACDHHETYRIGLYESTRPKDSTGAGDAFGSGFLAAYANGKDFRSSLVFASANSTSVVAHFGAKPGILTGHVRLHQMPIQQIDNPF